MSEVHCGNEVPCLKCLRGARLQAGIFFTPRYRLKAEATTTDAPARVQGLSVTRAIHRRHCMS